jgi:L-iditol 2-dehydrogenase
MKALVLTEYNHFEVQEVVQPKPGPEEVLIQVKACGICGSDVHGMDGSTGRRQPPIIMGHEAAGVIAQVGPNVSGWAAGDRVTFDSTIYCGRCHFCLQGRVNLCDHRRVLGVSCDEFRQNGAFAEYVVLPQRILYRLPDGLGFERATMVEALSIALHAVNRTAVKADDTVVVVGTGMIGLLVVQALRVAGCKRIIGIDADSSRLEMASKLGADETLCVGQTDVAGEVLNRTDGRGADAAIEVVGISQTIQTAIASLRKGGTLTLVGNFSPMVELPLQTVVMRELTVNGSCASCGEYPACLDLLARETILVDPLISAVVPLADGARWFQTLYKGESGLLKVVLKP